MIASHGIDFAFSSALAFDDGMYRTDRRGRA